MKYLKLIKTFKTYEYLIIGSGPGGATMARELARKGKKVIVIERGVLLSHLGTPEAARMGYDLTSILTPPVAKGGVIIWRAFMAGGSAVFSAGNGMRCLEKELVELGIKLHDEFAEAEEEMGIKPLDVALLSKGSEKLVQACLSLGYNMEPMPKFLDPSKCRTCSLCTWGCNNQSKWTPLRYLEEASIMGAEILYGTKVKKILVEKGIAKGILAERPDGEVQIMDQKIIVAAGGLATPVILIASGFKDVGEGLFLDLFVNVYGETNGVNLLDEPVMATLNKEFHESKGFMLSPYIGPAGTGPFTDLGKDGLKVNKLNLLGIMVKIKDDATGTVNADGSIIKPLSAKDRQRLDEGIEVAKKILIKAGVKKDSVIISRVQGAHPGGTAAIGKVVDHNLQTSIKNLYVCDGSVLPVSPGLPPILTIVSLAKWLAKRI